MSSLLEIIELVDGEIVLQREGGEGEPLLRMVFSPEVRAYLSDSQLELAKVMVHAGIEALSDSELRRVAGGQAADESISIDDQAVTASEGLRKQDHSEPGTGKKKTRGQLADEEADSKASAERELGVIKSSDLSSRRVLH